MYLGRIPVLKQIGRKASYRKVASYPRSWKRRLLSPPSYSNAGQSNSIGLETKVGLSVLSFHWFKLSSSSSPTTTPSSSNLHLPKQSVMGLVAVARGTFCIHSSIYEDVASSAASPLYQTTILVHYINYIKPTVRVHYIHTILVHYINPQYQSTISTLSTDNTSPIYPVHYIQSTLSSPLYLVHHIQYTISTHYINFINPLYQPTISSPLYPVHYIQSTISSLLYPANNINPTISSLLYPAHNINPTISTLHLQNWIRGTNIKQFICNTKNSEQGELFNEHARPLHPIS